MFINFNSNQVEIQPDDKSYRYREVMGDNSVTLYFSITEFIEFPVGSYIVYEGELYTLTRPANLKKIASRWFDYTLIFEGTQAELRKFKVRAADGTLKFPLMGTPLQHLQLIVDNLNIRSSGWVVGEFIDSPPKLISYNHTYCGDALRMLAEEWETEFEIIGKTVSLKKVEYNKNNPLPLSYGRGNGFRPGVGRINYDNSMPVEILYVQGGSRNIDYSKYGSRFLLLPKSETFVYEGREYITDQDGLYVRRNDKPLQTLNEDSIDLSDIYPKRESSVTNVVIVDEQKHLYDIEDSSIPEELDYSQLIIEGETLSIVFQSGALAGVEFQAKYIHASRKFEIVPTDLDGFRLPNSTLSPTIGDVFAVFGIMLPTEYISNPTTKTGASWDMFYEAVRCLYEKEDPRFSFTGELDGIWAKNDWINIGGKIKPGGYILFSDSQFQLSPVAIRIKSVKDFINNPYSPIIELSNITSKGGIVSSIGKISSNEVIAEELNRQSVNYTRRRFSDAKETIEMLSDALLSFQGAVNPIAVQTMSLLVGDESLQYRWVDDYLTPSPVAHVVEFDSNTKILTADGGYIQHMTLGIDSISSSRQSTDYSFWEVSPYTSAPLLDGQKKFFLYIKASKDIDTAEFILSETGIGIEEVTGFYHFLYGVLNGEFEGERSFVTLHGFTEVLPSRINTERIVSSDGQSYFDMLHSAMKLGDAFDFNSEGDGLLKLKGTIVQSQSGDESPIGVFRGAYNPTYTYYDGDTVTLNGNTWRYINTTPGSGHTPYEGSIYWTVIAAAGEQGDEGSGLELIFIRTTTSTAPSTPATSQQDNYVPINWNDHIGGVDATFQYEWVSKRTKTDGVWSSFSTPKLWAKFSFDGEDGIDGIDGKSIEFIFIRTTTSTAPGTPATSQQDNYVPINWNDDMGGVDATFQYEWVSKRTKTDGVWSSFSTPKLWAKFSFDGEDGNDADFWEYRYAKNGSTTTPPSLSTTSLNPSGWYLTVPTIGTLEYLWMTVAKKNGAGTALVQNWSTPVRMSGTKGEDGAAGPSPVFRGEWVTGAGKTYYGNENRVDIVKWAGTYWVTRIDAGTFIDDANNSPDISPQLWNSFGAQFESVATDLLFAQLAYIDNLGVRFLRTSQSGKRIFVNGTDNTMTFYNSDGDAVTIIDDDIDSGQAGTPIGGVKCINPTSGRVSYITANGTFANAAGMQFLPASTGTTTRASTVGMLFDRLLYNQYNDPITSAMAGVDATYDYEFNVSGVSTAPTSGAIYLVNSVYVVVRVTSISAGSGKVYADKYRGISEPPSSGTLTKSIGTGDTSIYFSSVVIYNKEHFAGFFKGKVTATDSIFGGGFGFRNEKVYEVPNTSYSYLQSDYNVFLGNNKAADNVTWYLPYASSYRKWECIELLSYNNFDLIIRALSGDMINGYAYTDRRIRFRNAEDTCTLMSNGSNMWIIRSLCGPGSLFESY
jgi:hypothetical protein